jgi:hypothetical protein
MFKIYYLKVKKEKNSTPYFNVMNINIIQIQCRNGDFLTITFKKCHQQSLKGWEKRKKSHYTNKPQLNLGKSIGSS